MRITITGGLGLLLGVALPACALGGPASAGAEQAASGEPVPRVVAGHGIARLADAGSSPAPRLESLMTGGAGLLAQAGRPQVTIGGRSAAEAPRSRMRAVGASLLLPGLGQRAYGHHGRARLYWMAEAAIWVGFIASRVQGRIRKEGYIEQAEVYAGIPDAGGHSDRFYRTLGNYSSCEDYRQDVAQEARALYGDDLAARDAYVAEITGGLPDWEWRSLSAQLEYRDRRRASRNAYRRASLFLGAALLNRLVSALDAAWLAGREKGRLGADAAAGGRIYYRPEEDGPGYLCLQWVF